MSGPRIDTFSNGVERRRRLTCECGHWFELFWSNPAGSFYYCSCGRRYDARNGRLLETDLGPRDEAHAAGGDAEACSPEPVVDAAGAESGPAERSRDGSAELGVGGAAVAGDRLEAEAGHPFDPGFRVGRNGDGWGGSSRDKIDTDLSTVREIGNLYLLEFLAQGIHDLLQSEVESGAYGWPFKCPCGACSLRRNRLRNRL